MADQGLYDKSTITTRQAGDFVRVNRAYAPNPSGRADYKIEVDNFLQPEQADIAQNALNISGIDTRVTTLENGLTKRVDLGVNGDYDFQQNADSVLIEMYFIVVSGSPAVAVGTTLGGAEIISNRLIEDGYRSNRTLSEYTSVDRTIYSAVSGGTVNVITYTRENLST